MKPETAAYLANSAEALKDAKAILAIGIPRHASRIMPNSMLHAGRDFDVLEKELGLLVLKP